MDIRTFMRLLDDSECDEILKHQELVWTFEECSKSTTWLEIERMLKGTMFNSNDPNEQVAEILKVYGHRQKQMMESAVEYKGLYHALRLIYHQKTH